MRIGVDARNRHGKRESDEPDRQYAMLVRVAAIWPADNKRSKLFSNATAIKISRNICKDSNMRRLLSRNATAIS
jgi:hypothetical protein